MPLGLYRILSCLFNVPLLHSVDCGLLLQEMVKEWNTLNIEGEEHTEYRTLEVVLT